MPFFYVNEWTYTTGIPQMPDHWAWPGDPVGLIDLRSLPQQGATSGTGYGLFVYDSPQAGMFVNLGSDLDGQMRVGQRSAIAQATGAVFASTTLRSILAEIFLTQGDPTGETRFKPLRGSYRGGVLFGAGSAEVVRTALSDQARANSIAIFRADYERNLLLLDDESRRRWIGGELRNRFGITDEQLALQSPEAESAADALLAPNRRSIGYAVPSTQVSDDFNRADENPVNGNWTKDENSFQILSNQIVNTANNTENDMRYSAHSHSSDDHYAQIDVVTHSNNYGGPTIRKASSATLTFYTAMLHGTSSHTLRLWKRVTGSFTPLDTTSVTHTASDTYRVEADSSDNLISKQNGSTVATVTSETSITGNVQAGVHLNSDTNARLDNWDSNELGGAATTRRYSLTLTGVG